MRAELTVAPAAEPLTLAEVKAHLRLDAGDQEPAPAAPAATLASPAAPGNVDNGAHRYLATFVTADGETQAGTATAAVTVADKAVNGQVSLTAIPLGGSAVTARKLYRTLAGGSTYYLLAAIADNSTTIYTDNIADASLGAGAPSANTTGDPLLAALIVAARQAAESATGRRLVTQRWRAWFDSFADDLVLAGLSPVGSVISASYVDSAGATQALAVETVQLVPTAPARIDLAYGASWPDVRDMAEAVSFTVEVGYGAASAVPQAIKQWMLLQAGAMYANRESVGERQAYPLPFADGLLDPYRVVTF